MADEEEEAGKSAAFAGTPIAVPVGPLDGDDVPAHEAEATLTALVEQTGERFDKLSRAATARMIRDLARQVDRSRPSPGVGPIIIGTMAFGLYVVGNSQAEKVGLSLAVATILVGVVAHLLHWVAWHNVAWNARRKLAKATGWPGSDVRRGLAAAVHARKALSREFDGRRLNQGIVLAVQHALVHGEVLRGKALRRLARLPAKKKRKRKKRRRKD